LINSADCSPPVYAQFEITQAKYFAYRLEHRIIIEWSGIGIDARHERGGEEKDCRCAAGEMDEGDCLDFDPCGTDVSSREFPTADQVFSSNILRPFNRFR
jgi:hypothetical protein